ncbi:hypothetical protein KSP40_PGU018911 [Platanthera guangdongensis]|uniref:Uncharacterized protein n=1 Tax=Platanthera guangdongensis TaxID=2320717 RepID=A0ABR2MFG3_9ASPA
MGDLQVYSLHLKGINGVIPGHTNPPAILPSMWPQAELATQEIIKHIQPTVVSEQRRKAVVEYVQKLIRGFVSSEVYGSLLLSQFILQFLVSFSRCSPTFPSTSPSSLCGCESRLRWKLPLMSLIFHVALSRNLPSPS